MRPEALAVAGYYPFPAHLLDALAALVTLDQSAAAYQTLALADLCAGEGQAISAIACSVPSATRGSSRCGSPPARWRRGVSPPSARAPGRNWDGSRSLWPPCTPTLSRWSHKRPEKTGPTSSSSIPRMGPSVGTGASNNNGWPASPRS